MAGHRLIQFVDLKESRARQSRGDRGLHDYE